MTATTPEPRPDDATEVNVTVPPVVSTQVPHQAPDDDADTDHDSADHGGLEATTGDDDQGSDDADQEASNDDN